MRLQSVFPSLQARFDSLQGRGYLPNMTTWIVPFHEHNLQDVLLKLKKCLDFMKSLLSLLYAQNDTMIFCLMQVRQYQFA